MALAKGYLGGFFCFGEETTWGTAIERTQELKLRRGGDGVEATQEEMMSEEIPNVYTDDSEAVIGNKTVGGPLTFACQYEGHEVIYKHALGNLASSQPDVTNDENTWLHTYTISNALPDAAGTEKGLTLEIDRDTHEYVCEGCKIASIEWSIDVNGLLVCTINISAEDAAFAEDPTGALTFPTAAYIKYSDQPTGGYVVIYDGATELKCTNLTWTLNNNLDVDRRYLGTNLISEQVRAGKVEVTGSMTIDFDSTDEYDDFIGHTTQTLVIEFNGATIDTNYAYTEQFLFDAVRIISGTPRVNDEGRVTVDVNWKAYAANTSNREMEIVQYNTVDDTYDT